jgi:hypothetical protein
MDAEKTYAALRRRAEKALDEAEGNSHEAFSLIRRRLHTGTTRDLALKEAIVDHAVFTMLSDVYWERLSKAKGGLTG